MDDGIIHVSDLDFTERVIESDLPVLVDFWAEWCGPCHAVAPVVEEIAHDLAGRLWVAKVNIDDSPNTARHYGILSIPTLVLFEGGEEKRRIVGARPKESVLQALAGDTAA
jgi:thioredoxin 1